MAVLVFKSPLLYCIMALQHKSSDAGNLDMPRSQNVLPLNEKVNVLNLIRKEKQMYAEVRHRYGKNKSSVYEIVKNEKEIHDSFCCCTSNWKTAATVHDKFLAKMEKALSLWVEDMNRNVFRLMAIRCGTILSFRNPLRSLGIYPSWVRGGYCICIYIVT